MKTIVPNTSIAHPHASLQHGVPVEVDDDLADELVRVGHATDYDPDLHGATPADTEAFDTLRLERDDLLARVAELEQANSGLTTELELAEQRVDELNEERAAVASGAGTPPPTGDGAGSDPAPQSAEQQAALEELAGIADDRDALKAKAKLLSLDIPANASSDRYLSELQAAILSSEA